MHADPRTDPASSHKQEPPKRPYRSPELRELGTLTELTHANPAGTGTTDASYTPGS